MNDATVVQITNEEIVSSSRGLSSSWMGGEEMRREGEATQESEAGVASS